MAVTSVCQTCSRAETEVTHRDQLHFLSTLIASPHSHPIHLASAVTAVSAATLMHISPSNVLNKQTLIAIHHHKPKNPEINVLSLGEFNISNVPSPGNVAKVFARQLTKPNGVLSWRIGEGLFSMSSGELTLVGEPVIAARGDALC